MVETDRKSVVGWDLGRMVASLENLVQLPESQTMEIIESGLF